MKTLDNLIESFSKCLYLGFTHKSGGEGGGETNERMISEINVLISEEPLKNQLDKYKKRLEQSKRSTQKLKALRDELLIAKKRLEEGTGSESLPPNNKSLEEKADLDNRNLLRLPISERLQNVTEPPVYYSDVATGKTSDLKFFFDKKNNIDLYQKTTAGQVLPEIVRQVEKEGKIYTRKSFNGEFFCKNQRLILIDETQIKVLGNSNPEEKLKTQEEFREIQGKNSKFFEEFKSQSEFLKVEETASPEEKTEKDIYADIAREAINKGIDPEFAIITFGDKLKSIKDDSERNIELQDMLAEFDRVRGKVGASNELKDGKYDNELAITLISKYSGAKWKDVATKHKYNPEEISSSSLDFNELPGGVKGLLAFLAKAEGTNDNYNAIYGNGGQNDIKYTDMTLAQIQVVQYKHGQKTGSSAMGRYQFMHDTFKEMINRYGFDTSQKFTPEFQDKLAILKLKERGLDRYLKSGKSEDDKAKFQYQLASEWASLPKDSSGKSVYDRDKMNNRARVKHDEIRSMLDKLSE